jgi:O-antigen ligase
MSFAASISKIFSGRKLNYDLRNISELGLLILFFVLPFPIKFSSITIGIVLLFSLIRVFRNRDFSKFRMHWFLPVLFIYYLLSELLTGGTWLSFEKRLVLIVVPLIFAMNQSFFEKPLRNKIYLSFILGNLIAIIFCIVRALFRSFYFEQGKPLFNYRVLRDTDYDFLQSSIMGGNYFFGSELSYFLHPTYFGLLIVFAQVLIFEVAQRKYRLLIVSYAASLFFLFFLSSKAIILSSLALTFYVIIKVGYSRTLQRTLIAFFVIVSVVFFLFNPRLKTFTESIYANNLINPEAHYGHALRILSWDAALEVINNNWILGVGEGKKEEAIVAAYEKKGYAFPAQEKFNSHNQYLDFLLGGGVIGLGIFVIGLSVLFVQSMRESNFLLNSFLMIFSFNALFENLLSRYWGLIFFSLFITLLGQRNSST